VKSESSKATDSEERTVVCRPNVNMTGGDISPTSILGVHEIGEQQPKRAKLLVLRVYSAACADKYSLA